MLYNKFQVIFLNEVMTLQPDSTNRYIAQMITEHLMELQDITIVGLAELCNVGTGSISRFCNDIGLHGFAELKQILIEEQQRLQTTQDTYFQTSNKAQSIQYAINQALSSLDQKKVQWLVSDLYRYPSIYAAGLLKAFNAANNLQSDLYLLGKNIQTDARFHNQVDYITSASETDLIIVFSYTGSYFDYERYTKYANQLKKPKIWMISGSSKNIPDYVDEVLLFDSKLDYQSHPYQLEAIASYIVEEYEKYIQTKKS